MYAIYVYYRVPAEAAKELQARLIAAHTALAVSTGVSGRLLHRSDEPLLWMEVYEGVADREAFFRALEQALSACRVTELIPFSSRKNEVFQEFQPAL